MKYRGAEYSILRELAELVSKERFHAFETLSASTTDRIVLMLIADDV